MLDTPNTQTPGLQAGDTRWYNEQAIALALQGKLDKAVQCLEAALQLCPHDADTYNNLGNVLFRQGRYDHAVTNYRLALCFDPNFVEACSNLANTLSALGKYKDAITRCRQALLLQPDYAEAYTNLGNAYQGLNRLDEALNCYHRALELSPDLGEAHVCLAAALAKLNRLEEAKTSLRAALRLKPDFAVAKYNLGHIFIRQADWDNAVVEFRQALQLQPDFPDAYHDLGYALGEQGKQEEAEYCFQQALSFKPDYVEGHWALALSRLVRGDFEAGWPEYEWRWRLKGFSYPRFRQPIWDGSSLTGRTILLHAEQGLGDTMQFVRYTAIVKQGGGRVVLQCQQPLLRLLASCSGIDQLVAVGAELPPFDVHAPLLSLPRILKTTLSTVPATIPYLFAEVKLQRNWQRRLRRYRGFRIGIAWQGNPQHPGDRRRSIPLAHFEPLAAIEDVSLISLQKGAGTEQLRAVAHLFPVIDLGRRLDENSGTFMDAPAVIKNLDLVITSDTAIAHLAGALGVPVWVALSSSADWRWLLHREDTPWYPTMRLFRQTKPGDWDSVFARMAEELSKKVATGRPTPFVTITIAPGELIDKITILEIKSGKITDPGKRRKVRAELAALRGVRDRDIGRRQDVASLSYQLRTVNKRLWQTEDEIRLCEKNKDFGPRFIELARSVYQQNDCRSLLKRRINELLGSSLVEQKVYATGK